jgi:hypothetical protein
MVIYKSGCALRDTRQYTNPTLVDRWGAPFLLFDFLFHFPDSKHLDNLIPPHRVKRFLPTTGVKSPPLPAHLKMYHF